MELEEMLDTECFLCGGPLIEGECLAYHWHDGIHRDNRKQIEAGLEPQAIEPVAIPEKGNWVPCWVCGARTDAEGRCTRVNDFVHEAPYSRWMGLFHSKEEALNAPPVTFLIKDFLQREGVTAIAAPVRERKSLIALNIAYALVTGERLFDYFEVVHKPKRVLYLCPEVSLGPFTDRVKKIGLIDYVGDRFFYRTMSSDHLELSDDNFREALRGSVVILDTAIRFLTGDENSSKDVRSFADSIFSLLKNGAEAVILLHHSPKDSGDTMTLENAMRGSGDMGAFLACCWGTKLQDPSDPYKSPSFLSNLKQRDFESQDFEVTCGPDCRMHIVGSPDSKLSLPPTLKPRRAFVGNKDGMDAPAIEFLKANPKLSAREAVTKLEELGIKRGKTWVSGQRYKLMQAGAVRAS